MAESGAAPPAVLVLVPVPTAAAYKQESWSPDSYRDEAWLKRKGNHKKRKRRQSVTDEDLDELKACIELGFRFDSPDLDLRLSNTLPALCLYHAVNKQYSDIVSKTPSPSPSPTATSTGSPISIFNAGDDPQMMKTRLKQWAQVVACSVRQSSY